jgi:DNA mismatch repair protein MSH3
MEAAGGVSNWHMGFMETEAEGETRHKEITFLYKVTRGLATRSYGLNVARLAGLPDPVIAEAGERSRGLEERCAERDAARFCKIYLDGNE